MKRIILIGSFLIAALPILCWGGAWSGYQTVTVSSDGQSVSGGFGVGLNPNTSRGEILISYTVGLSALIYAEDSTTGVTFVCSSAPGSATYATAEKLLRKARGYSVLYVSKSQGTCTYLSVSNTSDSLN